MYGRVPKWHCAVGLLGLYNLCPIYSFTTAALDRGHHPFDQSDWSPQSRDGISLYNLPLVY